MKKFHTAIAGATGLVGQEFIRILLQQDFPMASVRLLASDRSAGRKMQVGGDEVEVGEVPVWFQNAYRRAGLAGASLINVSVDVPDSDVFEAGV